jgi:hypothetical protein
MPTNLCVRRPTGRSYLVMHEYHVAITTTADGKEDRCAAMLLAFFEAWHTSKINAQQQARTFNSQTSSGCRQYDGLWQWHSLPRIEEGVLGLLTRNSIRKGIDRLRELGLIDVKQGEDPAHPWTLCNWYLLRVDEVQRCIDETYGVPQQPQMPDPQGDNEGGVKIDPTPVNFHPVPGEICSGGGSKLTGEGVKFDPHTPINHRSDHDSSPNDDANGRKREPAARKTTASASSLEPKGPNSEGARPKPTDYDRRRVLLMEHCGVNPSTAVKLAINANISTEQFEDVAELIRWKKTLPENRGKGIDFGGLAVTALRYPEKIRIPDHCRERARQQARENERRAIAGTAASLPRKMQDDEALRLSQIDDLYAALAEPEREAAVQALVKANKTNRYVTEGVTAAEPRAIFREMIIKMARQQRERKR